jgi:hypothetical protein
MGPRPPRRSAVAGALKHVRKCLLHEVPCLVPGSTQPQRCAVQQRELSGVERVGPAIPASWGRAVPVLGDRERESVAAVGVGSRRSVDGLAIVRA